MGINFVIPELNTKLDALDSTNTTNTANIATNASDIDALETLADGKIYVGNGSNVATEVTPSGDVTMTNAGVTAIGAGKVTEAMLVAPTSDGLNAGRIARVTYDFGTDGGSQGTIGLGVTLPDNALIRRAWYEVITTFTSATDAATVALNIPTDGDLVDAIAISDGTNPWDAGLHDIVNAANVAENVDAPTGYLKLTGAREVSLVIATEDLTAGKAIFFIDYVVSE